ncbi:MAG TPA: transposase [Bacteroidetes bacterium]|nr:transposase [Bacteroidota bacterium]
MTRKRTFTKEEKLQILKEAETQGVKITLEKHGIYPATYYSWKKKYEEMGEMGFRHGMTPAHIKEIRRLEKENATLKKLLAEKELEGHLKTEMLKKKYAWARKKL